MPDEGWWKHFLFYLNSLFLELIWTCADLPSSTFLLILIKLHDSCPLRHITTIMRTDCQIANSLLCLWHLQIIMPLSPETAVALQWDTKQQGIEKTTANILTNVIKAGRESSTPNYALLLPSVIMMKLTWWINLFDAGTDNNLWHEGFPGTELLRSHYILSPPCLFLFLPSFCFFVVCSFILYLFLSSTLNFKNTPKRNPKTNKCQNGRWYRCTCNMFMK